MAEVQKHRKQQPRIGTRKIDVIAGWFYAGAQYQDGQGCLIQAAGREQSSHQKAQDKGTDDLLKALVPEVP